LSKKHSWQSFLNNPHCERLLFHVHWERNVALCRTVTEWTVKCRT
jgi:hypothetical protein